MPNCHVCVAFILDHMLMDYRVPFFNMLAERGYCVTVFHSGDSRLIKNCEFNVQTVSVSSFSSKLDFRKIPDLSGFDIVVCMQNLRVINLWTLTINPLKKYKLIHWGIGTSSAKGLSMNRSIVSKIRNFLVWGASAQVLYSEFPLPLFDKVVKRKTFIANNTVYNPFSCDLSHEEKDSFLFIGSLNERKGLDLLIYAFAKVLGGDRNRIKKLIIIGDGPSKFQMIKLAEDLGISEYVFFAGNISDSGKKRDHFIKAVASISPLQAGLSVLESFSFGVPFICFSDAISGGEHLNIKNGENGYLVNSVEELTQRMLELGAQPKHAAKLGQNAYNYYVEKRQMKHMVDGFVSSFEFVMSN